MTPYDLERFNQAVGMAQAGQKTAAHGLLLELQPFYPKNADLSLWLAYTSPDLAEANQWLEKVARHDSANPALPGARSWLAQRHARENTVISPATSTFKIEPRPGSENTAATFQPNFQPQVRPVSLPQQTTGTFRPVSLTPQSQPYQPKLGYQFRTPAQQRIFYRAERPKLGERFGLGWEFIKQAAKMARDDSNLLKPSFFSIGLNVLVSLLLAVPFVMFYLANRNSLMLYLAIFMVLLVNYFITYLFSAVTIHLVHQNLKLGTSNMGLAWAVVQRGTFSILAVAEVSALISTFRGALVENQRGFFGFIGAILVRAIQAVWTTATFFILPAIVIEDLTMGAAVKRAAYIIKNNLLQIGVGYVGLGLIGGLLSLAFVLVGFGLGAVIFMLLSPLNPLVALVLALVAIVIMLGIASALYSYLRIAYYTCLFSWAVATERHGEFAVPPAPLRVALQSRAI